MNPNNITPAANDVASIENKHLLWAILTEEQVFTGLRKDKAPSIINIFETAINTVKNTYTANTNIGTSDDASAANLAALNKDVIRRVISEITRYKSAFATADAATAAATPSASSDTKYRAVDMQDARIRDITSKLKLHEDDMNSFLVLKKPAEINFADALTDDDRPIGDEMDRLIQAALATRAKEARELDVMQSSDKKTVSFTSADDSVSSIRENVDDAEKSLNVDAIINKLKRNSVPPEPKAVDNNSVLQSLAQSIAEIQRDLRDMKTMMVLLRSDRVGS
jgi:hypothetical protein